MAPITHNIQIGFMTSTKVASCVTVRTLPKPTSLHTGSISRSLHKKLLYFKVGSSSSQNQPWLLTFGQGTLRENILLGVDESTISDERLHEVCRDASIHEFIVSLPEGYNTNIGSRGVTLSGGQKQRVAIARALVRNPDILLLDEATSSLDSESEKLVQAAFERAGKGRTMVVVAHRLATVQNADVIFVLGEGKLLEQGNHKELLKKRGVYWQMVSYIQCHISTSLHHFTNVFGE